MASLPVPVILAATGSLYLAAVLYVVGWNVRLGAPGFFGAAAVMGIAFGLMLARVWARPGVPRHCLLIAFALAVLFRLPLASVDVGNSSDMVRYLWDGRIQRLGYNPYLVFPNDPQLAHTHTDQTAGMPSARIRTPYLPAAQLFFRLVVSIHDSTLALKLALVACDLLTIIVLWRWLAVTKRNEWLALAYAWHPLVVLEVAHSGHVDALVVLLIAAAAYWLTRGRTMPAMLAFVLAVMTKPLPIVLAPLFIGRVRGRDLLAGCLLAVALYLPFVSRADLPLGLMPGVVQYMRFNGPIYRAIAWVTMPAVAAAVAVSLGLAVASAARARMAPSNPAAWAWPMAVALLFAPMVYPWYLLSLTPFLFTWTTFPLTVWTFSVLPTYIVWQMANDGRPWAVPPAVMTAEYGVVGITAFFVYTYWRSRKAELA